MRISSKGCYAIAALMELAADEKNEPIPVATLATRLQISKIYLEQVFSIIKRSGIVISTKGAQGGYTLRESPEKITLHDILAPIESTLFESAEKSLESIPIEQSAIINNLVFKPLDDTICTTLKSVTLADLRQSTGDMYYI
ncbi:MAG: Rrf2 family transcriptional regulator [Defluviitaleaceae bacterium]|nr:Rrf2 family transcriptional regulator [Defluviitaleaceae bacterium]MCL2263635.1 Rrf2 family transcriptional regulator [Defluviitaleaceae bacterium]